MWPSKLPVQAEACGTGLSDLDVPQQRGTVRGKGFPAAGFFRSLEWKGTLPEEGIGPGLQG